MARMSEREIVALVDAEFSTAMGAPDGEIAQERAELWDYYLSKPIGNEVEGQSQVVTSDVADIVDGIMPSLMRMFTTADNLVSFDPVGPEDIEQAEQESDYVNHVFFKENPAFLILYNWAFDGLLQKNGIVKAWIEEKEKITTETYSNLSQEQLFRLLEDDELEPVERSEYIDQQTGQMMHDIQVKRVTKEKCYRIENVPPEEYRISADAHTLDPSYARMVGQEREMTRSDLLAMGFDGEIVDRLPAQNGASRTTEQIARYDRDEEEGEGSVFDRSQDLILVREAYIWCDFEGKGRSELRQVFTSGGYLLANEPADRQPFHVWSPQPLPHKHFGRATGERGKDIQKIGTTLLRQTLDNLYHSNNPGHAVNERMLGDYTLDDLLTRRVGGVTRFNGPIGEAWSPMTVPFTAGASFDMLGYFDKLKRDRTGVSSDAEGLKPDQLKHIQQSVMGQSMDMSRMKIELVARIFAETGIKSLFLHLHELISKHMDRKKLVRLRNRFVEVDPTRWRTRYDMSVNIGLGIASKESAMMMLERVTALQAQIVQNGGMGVLVTPANIYNTAAEIVKAAGLKVPDLYFTNPANAPPPEPQTDPALEAQIALQQQQQQIEMLKLQLREQEVALRHQENMARLSEQNDKNQNDLMIEVQKLQNQITEMELKYNTNLTGGV